MPRYLTSPACLIWLVPLLILWMAFMEFGPRSEMKLETVQLFDVTFWGYDGAYAKQVIGELGDEGRRIYLNWHFPLDMVFPLLYGATLYSLLAWTAPLNGLSSRAGRLIAALPILTAISDWAENILVFSTIAPEPPRTTLAPIASVFTQVKCLALVVSIVLSVGFGVRAAWLRWRLLRPKI